MVVFYLASCWRRAYLWGDGGAACAGPAAAPGVCWQRLPLLLFLYCFPLCCPPRVPDPVSSRWGGGMGSLGTTVAGASGAAVARASNGGGAAAVAAAVGGPSGEGAAASVAPAGSSGAERTSLWGSRYELRGIMGSTRMVGAL